MSRLDDDDEEYDVIVEKIDDPDDNYQRKFTFFIKNNVLIKNII